MKSARPSSQRCVASGELEDSASVDDHNGYAKGTRVKALHESYKVAKVWIKTWAREVRYLNMIILSASVSDETRP